MGMDLQINLIDQLEGVLASTDVSRRAEILRRITDVFVVGSGKFSEDQVELFDDVMGKRLENVERAARAQFGNRLSKLSDAPPKTIRDLAFDDAIEVAGPILQHSERLDDHALIEIAKAKGQGHLLAISGRKVLVEAVTDSPYPMGDFHLLFFASFLAHSESGQSRHFDRAPVTSVLPR